MLVGECEFLSTDVVISLATREWLGVGLKEGCLQYCFCFLSGSSLPKKVSIRLTVLRSKSVSVWEGMVPRLFSVGT